MEESYLHTCFAHFGETKTRVVCHLLCFLRAPRRVVAAHPASRPVLANAWTRAGNRPRGSDGRIALRVRVARPLPATPRPVPPDPDPPILKIQSWRRPKKLTTKNCHSN